MKNFESYKPGNFMKHGITAMAFATCATLLTTPLLASADCEHGHWDKSSHSEFMQQRQNALHDKLGLSASQQAAWNDFVVKSKPGEHPAKPDWAELSKLTTPERLDRMLSLMKDRQQHMEAHAQAVKTFYAQLTAEQKKIFDASFQPGRDHHENH